MTAFGAAHSASGRILVVDDSPEVRLVVRRVLELEGFEVDEAADGPAALASARVRPPDCVVLDIGIPGLDGLQVLARLRAEGRVPVILLTGRTEESDRVMGLDLGADDYVVKPFLVRELAARVRAVIRRDRPGGDGAERVAAGDLVVDRVAREVTVAGRVVPLTRREFDLLAFLARSPRQVFTREQILVQVWESSPEWQTARTVTEHVRRLRSAIEADPARPRWIQSVRGVGYRFVP